MITFQGKDGKPPQVEMKRVEDQDACVVVLSETIELDFLKDSFLKDGYLSQLAVIWKFLCLPIICIIELILFPLQLQSCFCYAESGRVAKGHTHPYIY